MVRVQTTGSKATKARARKTIAPKGRKSAKTKRGIAPSPSVADLQAQLERRTTELDRALERQTATADILKVIASSPSDVQPVFDAIAVQSNRLLNGLSTTVHRFVDDVVHLMAFTPVSPAADAALKAFFPIPLGGIIWGESIRKGEVFCIPDSQDELLPGRTQEIARARGWRSILFVPLVKDGASIGVIGVTRVEPGPFSENHVQILKTFADQAVIAIENARLFNETREALAYQTGSSNILKVIASSPTDVEPALKAIVDSACEICNAYDCSVVLKDGDDLVVSAHHGPIPPGFTRNPISRKWLTGRAVIDKVPQHVHDLLGSDGDDFRQGRDLARLHGYHTVLSVPLLRDGEAIGAIVLRRKEIQPFDDKQIERLKSFADQAVIAISNVRLFDEVQARTRELTKSLEELRTT